MTQDQEDHRDHENHGHRRGDGGEVWELQQLLNSEGDDPFAGLAQQAEAPGLSPEAGEAVLGELLGALGVDVDGRGEGPGGAAMDPPVHWPRLGPDEIEERMVALSGWVFDLQQRFPGMARRVPSCWPRHNSLIEPLQALWDYERACFSPDSPPTAAAGWHRVYVDIEQLLERHMSDLGCKGSSAGTRGHEPPRSNSELAAARTKAVEAAWQIAAETLDAGRVNDEAGASDSQLRPGRGEGPLRQEESR